MVGFAERKGDSYRLLGILPISPEVPGSQPVLTRMRDKPRTFSAGKDSAGSHFFPFNAPATELAIFSPNLTGTALPSCRIVSDQAPKNS